MAKGICVQQCWDGKNCRMYFPGEIDPFTEKPYDIDPKSDVAKYFEFPDLKKEEIKESEKEKIDISAERVDKRTKEYRDSKT